MNKKIKGLSLIVLLTLSTVAQAEQNVIASFAKAAAVGFSSGFGAIVVPYPAVSIAALAVSDNVYDRGYHHLSKLEKVALTGSAIAGAIAAIGVWYKAGEGITNALWGTDTGRYIAIVPAVETVFMTGLAYCLIKIDTALSFRSLFDHASSSESITERA